jgi:hypothetical protein
MIDSIAGGMMLAIPAPWTKKSRHSAQTGVCASTQTKPISESVTSTRPTAETARAPKRRTIAALRGANVSCATANGRNSRPVCSGV